MFKSNTIVSFICFLFAWSTVLSSTGVNVAQFQSTLCLIWLKMRSNAMFPLLRVVPRLKSLTKRGGPVKSFQILRSVVAIVLIVENVLTNKFFSTINTTYEMNWTCKGIYNIVMNTPKLNCWGPLSQWNTCETLVTTTKKSMHS